MKVTFENLVDQDIKWLGLWSDLTSHYFPSKGISYGEGPLLHLLSAVALEVIKQDERIVIWSLTLIDAQEGQEDLVCDVKGEGTTTIGSLGHSDDTLFLGREVVAPSVWQIMVDCIWYCVFSPQTPPFFGGGALKMR